VPQFIRTRGFWPELRARAGKAILPPSLLSHLPLTALRAGPLATLTGCLARASLLGLASLALSAHALELRGFYTAGMGAVSFRLFGFPISIHMSFLAVLGVIGLSWFQEIDRVVGVVIIAVVAILVHELGHAFAARSQGVVGAPTISLAGMAGVTSYQLQRDPSRAQSILISGAGPLAGIALGVVVLAVRVAGVGESDPFVDSMMRVGLFTTFGWSAFNLLPIVPLDGGHIMTQLLPGSQRVRLRRAAALSIVVAVIAGAWLFVVFKAFIAPAILAMFAWQNYVLLRDTGRSPDQTPAVAESDPLAEG